MKKICYNSKKVKSKEVCAITYIQMTQEAMHTKAYDLNY